MIALNLGSGPYLAPNYINVDKFFTKESLEANKDKAGTTYESQMYENKGEFVEGDLLNLPFEDNYADIIEAHQVFEHISIQDQEKAFSEVFRVLKKGGKFKMSVPSFNGLCVEWLANEIRSADFDPQYWYDRAQEFYGIQVNEGEYHRCPMTPNWIVYCLSRVGFKNGASVILFPRNGAMPKDEKFGIMATSPKPFGDATGFRHETIFVEIEK